MANKMGGRVMYDVFQGICELVRVIWYYLLKNEMKLDRK
jgi:hypothetical protein